MKHKYLIISDLGHEVPILFPVSIPHDQIVKHGSINNEAIRIVAAGFVSIGLVIERMRTPCKAHELIEGYAARLDIHCSGESDTLQIKSRGEDAEIIRRFLMGEDD